MKHATSIAPDTAAADTVRRGSAAVLAQALRDSRRDTLATFAAFEAALPGLRVPLHPDLNPPLWELGHIGWFQQHWTHHNPQRERGWDADPLCVPATPDDTRYDSGAVPHDQRWQLALPDADATRERLALQLEHTLHGLAHTPDDARALYFHRLVLLHEDMHHEAALYMARHLGVPITDPRWQAPRLPAPGPALELPAGRLTLGGDMAGGFRFDNECGQHTLDLQATTMDAQVLRWAEYLPFVDAGHAPPRYLRRAGGGDAWEQWRHGRWQPLALDEPACHLSALEARAWCDWAGRRLPTEAEWVWARQHHPQAMRWGDVWEWTASAFEPWPGFRPHPYRDYSAPWFDGRPVLRGASYLTQPRLRHPDYRNFFPATRSDIPAGLRTCAA